MMAATTLPATREATPAPALRGPAEITVEPAIRRFGALPLAAVLGAGVQLVLVGALLGAYLAFRHVTSPWPSEGVSLDGYVGNVISITALMQAFTVQWAARSARIDDQRDLNMALVLAIVLGAAIANGIWYAMANAGFGITDGQYGVVYYAIHATMLAASLIGVGVLIVTLARSIGGHFSPERRQAVQATAIHWHGQVVTWLAVWAIVWVQK
jgi:heme/copper-type cytochrome/quinol oxidase subunit 3